MTRKITAAALAAILAALALTWTWGTRISVEHRPAPSAAAHR
jgi:hypothetical protein